VIYCVDTSVLIESWRWRYPPDIAESFWIGLDTEMRAATAVIPDEVLIELERKDDDLYRWLKEREDLLVPPTPEIQQALKQVLARFNKIVDGRSAKNRADPLVVATALVKNATVITEEKHSAGPPNKPNIATLCDGFGVPHISLIDFMRHRRWRLSLSRGGER
jgi:predicted nucleic acid-binding protein